MKSSRITFVLPLILMIAISTPAIEFDLTNEKQWFSSDDPPAETSPESLSPPDVDHRAETNSSDRAATISHRVTGVALRPRSASVDFANAGTTTCTYANSNGSVVFAAPVWLPQGTTINSLRMYYNDTSEFNSTGWLSAYDSYGALVMEWQVNSTGNTGPPAPTIFQDRFQSL